MHDDSRLLSAPLEHWKNSSARYLRVLVVKNGPDVLSQALECCGSARCIGVICRGPVIRITTMRPVSDRHCHPKRDGSKSAQRCYCEGPEDWRRDASTATGVHAWVRRLGVSGGIAIC